MMPRRIATVGILVLALAMVLTGCEKRTEYVIGAVLASTGSGSTYAEDIRRGMDIAVDEVNAAGGVQDLPLRVIYEDSGSDPQRALQAAERLMGDPDRVPAIIGGVLSHETIAIAPKAQEQRVVLISPASSSPSITGAGSYIFRVYPSDVVEGTIMAEFMLNKLKRSRIMIVAVNNEYGRGLKQVFAKKYRSIPNRKILKVVNFDQGTTDWDETIRRVEEAQPDGLYLVGYPEEMKSFLEALRASRISYVQVLASRSFDVEMLKSEVAEGVIFPRDPFDPSITKEAAAFAEAYRGKHGVEPSIWAANGYDTVQLLAQAMNEVGGRSDKIRNWLDQLLEWQGASGRITFDPQGDVGKIPVVSIVHDSQFLTVLEYEELIAGS